MNHVWDRKGEKVAMLLTECYSAIEVFKALPVKQMNCKNRNKSNKTA